MVCPLAFFPCPFGGWGPGGFQPCYRALSGCPAFICYSSWFAKARARPLCAPAPPSEKKALPSSWFWLLRCDSSWSVWLIGRGLPPGLFPVPLRGLGAGGLSALFLGSIWVVQPLSVIHRGLQRFFSEGGAPAMSLPLEPPERRVPKPQGACQPARTPPHVSRKSPQPPAAGAANAAVWRHHPPSRRRCQRCRQRCCAAKVFGCRPSVPPPPTLPPTLLRGQGFWRPSVRPAAAVIALSVNVLAADADAANAAADAAANAATRQSFLAVVRPSCRRSWCAISPPYSAADAAADAAARQSFLASVRPSRRRPWRAISPTDAAANAAADAATRQSFLASVRPSRRC